MIREEYNYSDVSDYLINSKTLLIAGYPSKEERSYHLSEIWKKASMDVIFLERCDNDIGNVKVEYILKGNCDSTIVDLRSNLVPLLRCLQIESQNVLLDISSLDNILIMYLAKQFISQIIPKSFFAAYIRPIKYVQQSGTVGYALCDQVSSVKAVPGFAKRVSDKQSLYAFLGFDGIRLKNILETENNIEKFVPIIPFPTGIPQWYNVTMWNSMDVLQSYSEEVAIRKCFSDSVFEAIELLEREIQTNQSVILVPLGTRPHSLACAIFATRHNNAKIIYDYVIEHEHRAIGVGKITIYHLSSFLKT